MAGALQPNQGWMPAVPPPPPEVWPPDPYTPIWPQKRSAAPTALEPPPLKSTSPVIWNLVIWNLVPAGDQVEAEHTFLF